jgi:predicted enzyme related to lactoylglutathione lyase
MIHPAHGQLGYLQIPAVDPDASGAFYAAVLGWTADPPGFTAPGLIGQWVTDRPPVPDAGPLLWFCVEALGTALTRAAQHGGQLVTKPFLDGGERWLAEIEDPAGNRLGIVAPMRVAQAQTLLTVTDVEASSRWYQELLGLRSDHGGPEYERLLAGDTLVLQLHHRDVEHHHGPIPAGSGEGALVWFGEVDDFDGVVTRASGLGVEVVMASHRNPPSGQGNGPGHREIWLRDPDGYTVVVASPDGEAAEL